MSASTAEGGSKIRTEHLERKAYVYIRQSSPRQVREHEEGRRRQYDLVDWAETLGWPRERIVVLDEDQGKTGSEPNDRPGFKDMV